jgi:hypothetical protein
MLIRYPNRRVPEPPPSLRYHPYDPAEILPSRAGGRGGVQVLRAPHLLLPHDRQVRPKLGKADAGRNAPSRMCLGAAQRRGERRGRTSQVHRVDVSLCRLRVTRNQSAPPIRRQFRPAEMAAQASRSSGGSLRHSWQMSQVALRMPRQPADVCRTSARNRELRDFTSDRQ